MRTLIRIQLSYLNLNKIVNLTHIHKKKKKNEETV